MDAQRRERGRGRTIANTLPPTGAFNANGLVAVHGDVNVIQTPTQTLDHGRDAGHVLVRTGNNQGALVAVTVVTDAKVILWINDKKLYVHGNQFSCPLGLCVSV